MEKLLKRQFAFVPYDDFDLMSSLNFISYTLRHTSECFFSSLASVSFIESRELIYSPMGFHRFCMASGAAGIFDEIFNAMMERRHSEKRKANNKLSTMNTIYKMCYGNSQKCNFIQKQHGIY